MEFPISRRSLSLAGLSVITMIYDDDISTFTARQEVLDRLAQATMPTGVNPGLGPDYSPTGGFCVSLERKRRVATRLLEVGSLCRGGERLYVSELRQERVLIVVTGA
jgi:Cu/Ag efflux pump CusA